MAEEDFEMDLDAVLGGKDGEDISFDGIKDDAGLEDFLNDVSLESKSADFANISMDDKKDSIAETKHDDVADLNSATANDFASFDIDDFDAALNSYQAARAGKLPRNAPQPQIQAQPKPQPQPQPEPVLSQSQSEPEIENSEMANFDDLADLSSDFVIEREHVAEAEKLAEEVSAPRSSENKKKFNPSTIDESNFKNNSDERQQNILNWYMGKLKDKTYEISADNMPEFLDSDKTIRVVHVAVDSTYGWNVFFDNGVFMSLRDLKEYQERHGEMPCQDGKIIYGSKTTNFERILRIIVYERPRYFSYVVK